MAFDDPDGFAERELDLAGDELSMAELAETFTNLLDEDVEYHWLDWADYREQAGEEYADMWQWFEDVGYEADIDELRSLHPGLIRFEQYLRTADWLPAGVEG